MDRGPPPPNELLPNLHWEHSMNPFRSIITSPPPPAAISDDTRTSQNSMPTSYLMPFPTDSGFTERAARYSCFSSDNCGASFAAQFGIPGTGKQLSRLSSTQSLKAKETPIESREDSSITDHGSSPRECNARKRKAVPKSKAKMVEEDGLNAKKYRSAETMGEQNGEEKQSKDNGSKLSEPSNDYIHVRARRGQATDSHSLAERVRREKINQRMKLLQDIVPGCYKLTGKALMLDEIINYVQSLQRQVEFLSMKLASVNPRSGCNFDNISKEPLMSQANVFLPSLINSDNSAITSPFSHQFKEGKPLHFAVTNGIETHSSMSHFEAILRQTPGMQPTYLDVYGAADSQVGNLWDDDLRSIVQMSLFADKEVGLTSQNFRGS